MLIGGRFFAGVGGAFASAVVLGMIVTMFPEPREQAKAIGVFGFVASAGGSIGLLAGGVLTQAISWHWIFLINLPIGIGVALGAQRLVPSRPGIGLKEGADVARRRPDHRLADDRHLRDPRGQRARLGLRPDARSSAPSRPPCSPPSSSARRGSRTR